MSDFLFDAPVVLSPRLAWMEKHGVETHRANATGEGGSTWVCRKIRPRLESLWTSSEIGGGETEDEALAAFAMHAGLKLWNEEGQS